MTDRPPRRKWGRPEPNSKAHADFRLTLLLVSFLTFYIRHVLRNPILDSGHRSLRVAVAICIAQSFVQMLHMTIASGPMKKWGRHPKLPALLRLAHAHTKRFGD